MIRYVTDKNINPPKNSNESLESGNLHLDQFCFKKSKISEKVNSEKLLHLTPSSSCPLFLQMRLRDSAEKGGSGLMVQVLKSTAFDLGGSVETEKFENISSINASEITDKSLIILVAVDFFEVSNFGQNGFLSIVGETSDKWSITIIRCRTRI